MYKKLTHTILVRSGLIVLLLALLVSSCAPGATELPPQPTEVPSHGAAGPDGPPRTRA